MVSMSIFGGKRTKLDVVLKFDADHVELRVVGVSQQPHEVRVVQVAADVYLRDEILKRKPPATL